MALESPQLQNGGSSAGEFYPLGLHRNRHNFVSARRTAVFGVHPLIMTFSIAAFLQGIAYFILPAPSNSIPAGLQWLASAAFGGAPIAVSRSRSTAFPERPF